MRFNNTVGYQGIQGVWEINNNNEYICVWLDKDFKDSFDHEACHSLVYNNYEHFCK